MTVAELILALHELPHDLPVYSSDDYGVHLVEGAKEDCLNSGPIVLLS